MYGQTALGRMNAILDNRVQVEPAQVVRGIGETPLCNLAHVFTLNENEQGSNLMGISEQKLQNIDAHQKKKQKRTSPKTTTNTKQKLKSFL